MNSFWKNLKKPLFGLAPMDGVTDAAFRYITDKYGKPDVLFTEFTSVEGIAHGAYKLLYAFIHHQTRTPTVAQIYGADPKLFYNAAIIAAEMGFDGVDINMGCPDKSVTKKGAGAALIRDPKRAQKIIEETRRGLKEWTKGQSLEKIHLHPNIYKFVKSYQETYNIEPVRKNLPVSIKTRIGFDTIVITEWIKYLLDKEPAAITIHGRTLQQLYNGKADWEEIGNAGQIAKNYPTFILGNGDISSLTEAKEKVIQYDLDGVLIGRGAWGNPWIFLDQQADFHTRMNVAMEHCRVFMQFTPNQHFHSLRKHLAWYCKGIDYAASWRTELMQVNTLKDVEKIITSIDIPVIQT